MQNIFFCLPRLLEIALFPPVFVFALLHELCHYFAARALGLRAELHWNFVVVDAVETNLQWLMFLIAPAVAGLILFSVFIMWAWNSNSFVGLVVATWCALAWQAAASDDWRVIFHFLRFGEWCVND